MTARSVRPVLPSTQRRSDPPTGAQHASTATAAVPARPPRDNRVNPVRISRIGTDGIQVIIRHVSSDAEMAALVERMDQLVAAGFETIDVVFEEAPEEGAGSRGSTTTPVAA